MISIEGVPAGPRLKGRAEQEIYIYMSSGAAIFVMGPAGSGKVFALFLSPGAVVVLMASQRDLVDGLCGADTALREHREGGPLDQLGSGCRAL